VKLGEEVGEGSGAIFLNGRLHNVGDSAKDGSQNQAGSCKLSVFLPACGRAFQERETNHMVGWGENGASRKQAIGLAVHMLRQVEDWSLLELQHRSGVPQSTLSRIENGKGSRYDIDRLADIAKAFGLELEQLMATARQLAGILSNATTLEKLRPHGTASLPDAA
jgi:transcriptional regulator with XRE-family HTH domain